MTEDNASAAPCYVPGVAGSPWYRRALAQGAGYMAPSALFVTLPVVFAFIDGGAVAAWMIAAPCLAILVFFLGSTLVMHWPEAGRWLWLAGLIASIIWAGSFPDTRAVYFAPFITCVAVMLLAWKHAMPVMIVVTAAAIGYSLLQADLFGVVMALMGLVLAISIGSSLRHQAAQEALRRAEERTAVLAVAAERERIGRDLHDILGHSLTTIAVKADLAERLTGRDPRAAAEQIRELAAVARQALKDVRATAAGIREVRLATEIASARSVLTSAGIECRTPSALPVLDDEQSQLLGFVVREAITNVVRHSGATVCTITTTPEGVRISDNGRGFHGSPGNGLRGLSARVREAGGHLEVISDDTGTAVSALVVPAELEHRTPARGRG